MQEELFRQYIESLQNRIGRIDTLLEKLAEGNAKAGENIRILGHSLHGSGATFGFPEISDAGAAVEKADDTALESALTALKAVLEKVIAENAGTPAPAPQAKDSPKPAGKPVNAPRAEVQDQSRKTLNILVVDDDPEITDLICTVLKQLPKKQQFTVANSAQKAEECLVGNSYDLIIMDLVLPDRDGRQLIRDIKMEFRISAPLLVISSIQNDAVRVECMGLGADKCLPKPFYEEDLLREAKKLLGKKAQQKLSLVPMDGEAVEEEADEEEEERAMFLKGYSILVAEDDKMQAAVIKQRLAEEGAAVTHANNGREAMQELRSKQFSLVILDGKMPVMDGFEVLGRLRGELNLKELPVIMVTAMNSEVDIIRGYELGATDYMLKPFSEVQLVARVKTLLRPKGA